MKCYEIFMVASPERKKCMCELSSHDITPFR